MKKTLVLAFAAAVLMVAPAFAAVQNVKVSGDIDSTYLNRNEFNLGVKNASGIENVGVVHQSLFLTQTRLRVDADLSDNVSTTIRLLNERVWGGQISSTSLNNNQTQIDIDLAYVTLREFLYSPLTVTVGRQEFVYGNGLILGGNGPNNSTSGGLMNVAGDMSKQASNDGVKFVFDYKPLTVDLVYIKGATNENIAANTVANYESTKNDTDVYGVNTNYQLGDEMNSVVEGYFWAKVDKSNFHTGNKANTTYVPGLRVSTTPVKGFTTQAEVAVQGGRIDTSVAPSSRKGVARRAFAAQFMGSYALPVADLEKYKPTLNASYSYFSGDKNLSSGINKTYTAWDPMFEGQNGGTIFNSLFTLSNLSILNVGASFSPLQDVTTSLNWYSLNKVQRDGVLSLTQPDASTSVSPTINNKKGLGNEYDVNVAYAYTEDVTLGVNLGYYIPGSAFASANDSTATQAIGRVNVNF